MHGDEDTLPPDGKVPMTSLSPTARARWQVGLLITVLLFVIGGAATVMADSINEKHHAAMERIGSMESAFKGVPDRLTRIETKLDLLMEERGIKLRGDETRKVIKEIDR